MKKLIAGVLILLVVLNAVLLWPKSKAQTEESGRPTLKLPQVSLNDIKPGILPGLIKY